MPIARVKQIILDKYIIIGEEKIEKEATLRGTVKKRNAVLVGDKVRYEESYDKWMIEEVLERKNSLIRPPVANIDCLIIMVSIQNPKPDYLLLDKEILLCLAKKITPVICVNKVDLVQECNEDYQYIKKVYGALGYPVLFTSIYDESSIDSLRDLLRGKISAFSGNSGVGKSSVVNNLLKNTLIEVGDLGEKTKRGKHTTKSVSLFEIEENTYILDTPGFSSYELYDIPYKELKHWYEEFRGINCDYEDCNHFSESIEVCGVKKAVAEGMIDAKRFERYGYLYQKLKEIDDRKYK